MILSMTRNGENVETTHGEELEGVVKGFEHGDANSLPSYRRNSSTRTGY